MKEIEIYFMLITCELKDEFYEYLSNIFGNNNVISYSELINAE